MQRALRMNLYDPIEVFSNDPRLRHLPDFGDAGQAVATPQSPDAG